MVAIRTSQGVLSAVSTPIEVTSLSPEPDPNWHYTDREGHEHRYDNGYPTLVSVADETYWCGDCNDEHADSHLECPLCHETIRPGTRGPSAFRQFIQGPVEYYLDDEPISPERYEELRAAILAEREARPPDMR